MDARRSRTPLVLGIVGAVACLALVLLLIISVTVGILVYRGGEEGASRPAGPVESSPVESGPVSTGSATEGPSAEADPSSDAPEEGGIRADELVLPPGVAPDQPYLELSTSEDGPVVDVFRDFLCPPCKDFQRIQGDDLIQLALDNEITLRVHPRPMLDATSDPPGYSSRAAHAAVCAYAQNPEKWFPAEITLFENQPGNEGLPDHELIYLVNEAAGLDISACQAEGAYHVWLQDVVEPAALKSVSGTPSVLIDGELFTGDLGRSGTLKEAVAAA
ncbi:thioredoxin domain-containing protein [uncultured Brachybacterium sp.]|uniref:DsbA family protein n=1 Tax=uncultured Brachybacterium sp. TaxID=189680 RepID=UPI00261E7B03|nr:thioredoxin domain-containing protein [uncultured Brachybacterium sp.]